MKKRIFITAMLFVFTVWAASTQTGTAFVWPLKVPFRITQGFGEQNAWFTFDDTSDTFVHGGLDMYVLKGTPVVAAGGGTVSALGEHDTFGKYIIIDHAGGWQTLYAQLDGIEVSQSEQVRAGQQIGQSGDTGFVTGPHLHFSVYKSGKPVDPVSVLPKR